MPANTTEITIAAEHIAHIVKTYPIHHIAIIMDGNRRWAKENSKDPASGHLAGVHTIKRLLTTINNIGLPYLTIYAFSTENWQRSAIEVNFLMSLFLSTLNNELKDLNKNNVKIKFLGNISQLPDKLQKSIQQAEDLTSTNTGVTLQIATNYGSRAEIIHAVQQIIKDVQKGTLTASQITEDLFSTYLYTKNVPDPDILIRTGGEMRLSNYLLWQSAYTEIFITQTLWPDFSVHELLKTIQDFAQRDRRFGKG